MDLKIFYQKVREAEMQIADDTTVVVSRETGDGGIVQQPLPWFNQPDDEETKCNESQRNLGPQHLHCEGQVIKIIAPEWPHCFSC